MSSPRLLGVLNVTPDSFSDGGQFLTVEAAVRQGVRLRDEGAERVDVGGESTRPGAAAVPVEIEKARILPVITALVAEGVQVSVDTRRAEVACAALDVGASMVNDVSGGADPGMFPLIAARGCPYVLMHMRGEPGTMAELARYGDVVGAVWAELGARAADARRAGVQEPQLILDPGIGFAKTFEHNIALITDLPNHRAQVVMLGVSRKSMFSRLGGGVDPASRLPGSLAVALWAAQAGVAWLRVHDVAATRQALVAWDAVSAGVTP